MVLKSYKELALIVSLLLELNLKKIKPIILYDLPLEYQKVVDGDCLGIYCFIHKNTNKYGIGSALFCRNRLIDHMNSFNGHRLRSHIHN